MLRMTGLMSVVVLALAVLLFWMGSANSRARFKFGFVLECATIGIVLFFSRSASAEGAMRLRMDSVMQFIRIPFVIMPLLPFVLLLETGALGYRAFASPVRYLPLMMAILGAVGIVASLLVPYFSADENSAETWERFGVSGQVVL